MDRYFQKLYYAYVNNKIESFKYSINLVNRNLVQKLKSKTSKFGSLMNRRSCFSIFVKNEAYNIYILKENTH